MNTVRLAVIAGCLTGIIAGAGAAYLGVKSIRPSLAPITASSQAGEPREQNSEWKNVLLDPIQSNLVQINHELSYINQKIKKQEAEIDYLKTAVGKKTIPYSITTPPESVSEKSALSLQMVSDLEHESQKQTKALITRIATAFQIEPSDPIWAPKTIDAIEELFTKKELENSALVKAECAATLCQIVVEHSSREQLENFEFEFPFLTASVLSSAIYDHEEQTDGSIKTTIYIARAGHQLP